MKLDETIKKQIILFLLCSVTNLNAQCVEQAIDSFKNIGLFSNELICKSLLYNKSKENGKIVSRSYEDAKKNALAQINGNVEKCESIAGTYTQQKDNFEYNLNFKYFDNPFIYAQGFEQSAILCEKNCTKKGLAIKIDGEWFLFRPKMQKYGENYVINSFVQGLKRKDLCDRFDITYIKFNEDKTGAIEYKNGNSLYLKFDVSKTIEDKLDENKYTKILELLKENKNSIRIPPEMYELKSNAEYIEAKNKKQYRWEIRIPRQDNKKK